MRKSDCLEYHTPNPDVAPRGRRPNKRARTVPVEEDVCGTCSDDEEHDDDDMEHEAEFSGAEDDYDDEDDE